MLLPESNYNIRYVGALSWSQCMAVLYQLDFLFPLLDPFYLWSSITSIKIARVLNSMMSFQTHVLRNIIWVSVIFNESTFSKYDRGYHPLFANCRIYFASCSLSGC